MTVKAYSLDGSMMYAVYIGDEVLTANADRVKAIFQAIEILNARLGR